MSAAEEMVTEWRRILESELEGRLCGGDASHDLGHCRRVWRTAGQIADQLAEPVDKLVLLAAAYLHDIVSREKNDPGRAASSREAAKLAQEILSQHRFPTESLPAVSHAIEAHSFSAGVRPETIEAKIIQDADRIDAIGAVGIARLFYTAGRLGTKFCHETDPAGRQRPLDDQSFAVDHFYLKLLLLSETMNTAPGRSIAQERTRFAQEFIGSLLSEAGFH